MDYLVILGFTLKLKLGELCGWCWAQRAGFNLVALSLEFELVFSVSE